MPEDSFSEWESLCPPNHYKIIKPSELPAPIPDALKDKCSHAVMISSGVVGTSTVWCMVNLNRLDKKDNAIDQEPFIYAVRDGEFLPSGCIVHHGDWEGRTVALPEIVPTVTSSLLEDIITGHFPAEVGTIGALSPDNPYIRAFGIVVEEMKKVLK